MKQTRMPAHSKQLGSRRHIAFDKQTIKNSYYLVIAAVFSVAARCVSLASAGCRASGLSIAGFRAS
eukprot:scaffold171113_cov25-Prasinocladus_malaysianus.AAC.1